jgi:NifB/MoaA-like Fe-S oxidoreductase
MFASVQQNRVVRFAEMIVEDYRNGFTSGRGTTDNILVLKPIIEKHMNVT